MVSRLDNQRVDRLVSHQYNQRANLVFLPGSHRRARRVNQPVYQVVNHLENLLDNQLGNQQGNPLGNLRGNLRGNLHVDPRGSQLQTRRTPRVSRLLSHQVNQLADPHNGRRECQRVNQQDSLLDNLRGNQHGILQGNQL